MNVPCTPWGQLFLPAAVRCLEFVPETSAACSSSLYPEEAPRGITLCPSRTASPLLLVSWTLHSSPSTGTSSPLFSTMGDICGLRPEPGTGEFGVGFSRKVNGAFGSYRVCYVTLGVEGHK